MKRALTSLAVVCALMMAFPAVAKNQKPGKWEITMQTDMPGMQNMKPIVITSCVTKEQAEANEPPTNPNQRDKDCKMTDMKTTGNTISWKINCPKSGVSGQGTASYSSETFQATMKMHMQGMDVQSKMSGKWMGACDAKK